MAIAFGHKGGIVGLGEESTYGTSVARTKFIEITSDSTDHSQDRMRVAGINGNSIDKTDIELGRITAGGDLGFEARYEGNELVYKHAMGGAAVAEVATFATTTASNDVIKFKEDGGGELSATVAQATLIMGETSATASSHCLAVKTALEAAGAGTYTVTFSNVTKKMTIAVAGAVAAVQYINTGSTGGALIGFTADSSSSASIVADTAVVTVFDHTFTITDALPTGLSVEVDVDNESKLFEGGKINTLDMTVENDGFLNETMSIVAENMTKDSVTASTLSTSPLIKFNDINVTYDGGAINGCVKSLNINLANGLDTERYCLNSDVVSEPVRSAERRTVTGTITVDYDSADTWYADWLAATDSALVATATYGTVIKAGFSYTMTLTLPTIIPDNATQKINDPGIIPLEVPFTAYSDGATNEMTIVLRNTLSSV
jgi:hypothetical protein